MVMADGGGGWKLDGKEGFYPRRCLILNHTRLER